MFALLRSQSLTQGENYFYQRTYLEPVTTESPTAKQIQSVQYLDGLGRAKQSIAIKGSPLGKDVAVPSVYDSDGRQTKSYLPLPVDSQNGALLTTVSESAINTYYGVANAFSEIQAEKSPLGRLEKSAAPGTDWKMSGSHTQTVAYQNNASGVVKRFKATTSWNNTTQINDVTLIIAPDDNYSSNGYYNAGTLFKVVNTDEDGNETHTYTNGMGQNILIRQVNKKPDGSIENLDTYYVYDEFGNNSFIIPPKASVSALSQSVLDKLCYQYKYDKYKRLVERKVPGKDWEFLVYDKQDRVVLAQDAKLRGTSNNFGQQGWMFTKYDKFGRVVYSGFFANTASRSSMQTALNNMSVNPLNNEERSTTLITQNGLNIYYTKNAFPTGSITVLGVHYYDDYPTGAPVQPSQIQTQNTLGSAPTSITSNGLTSIRSTQSMSTASFTRNIENNAWSSAFIWYDTQGRVIGTYGNNHLGGFTKTETVLDFIGKIKETYTYHSRNTQSTQITVKDRYEYSPQNFLLKHFQKIGNNAEELLAEHTYNDLGQLINKKVGNNLQSIDYTYNLRGWLTGINPNQISNLGSKLFAYKIKYNTVEGAETPNNEYNTFKVKPKYNGGIAEIDWKTAYGANEPVRRYGYVYDGANRLRAGFFQMESNPYTKEYSEITDYDLNGNMTTLTRTGAVVNSVAEVMDDLNYVYDGNQLTYVEETGKGNAVSGYPIAAKGLTIKYDGNGNMTDHLDKGFSAISYNFLNLPSVITSTTASNSLSYIYAADGSKLQMTKGTEVTDYLENFQYTSTAGAIVSSILANEEGYYDFVNSRYVYQYADHLGNIRLSYTKNSSGGAIVLEENNYYPFGLKHKGYNTGDTTGNKFKYLYNSKELQSNGNLDYGWRQYMPDLGRWNGIDQLAGSYHYASPYAYVLNNPVNLFDPDGRLSQAFIDALWNASGSGTTTWYNTGNGFESDGHVLIGYEGNYLSLNTAISGGGTGGGGNGTGGGGSNSGLASGGSDNDVAGTAYLAGIHLTGTHNNWGQAFQNAFNSLMKGWNFQSDRAWDRMVNAGRYNDGGVMMLSGDVFGFSDLIGIGIAKLAPDSGPVFFALSAIAIVATKGRAADDIIKAEAAITKTEIVATKAELQYTKSNLKLGREMHSAYKAKDVIENIATKEFRLPSGRRIDFLDIQNQTIYELKPFNPRAMKAGEKQLQMYKTELESMQQFQGIKWKTVLDTY